MANRLVVRNQSSITHKRRKLPKSGSGALTCSLKPSSRFKQRRRVRESLDEPSIQVLTRTNLPLTLALHTDQIGKDHIHHTGQVHKEVIERAEGRLNTRHNKHVIEQWDYQHNRGTPFPEIPLPLTVKRSGDCRNFWATQQVHNEIIRRASKTIDSYLPEHVMAMRRRKTRNRNIILSNHGKQQAQNKKLKVQRRLAKSQKIISNSNKSSSINKYSEKHNLKPASAQQLRDWSFRENVVATTLKMYAKKKVLKGSGFESARSCRSNGDISINDQADFNEPFLKQQGPAGLSINYLRSSLTPSPGISASNRPSNSTKAQHMRLSKSALALRNKNGKQNGKKSNRKKSNRPQSASHKRRPSQKNGGGSQNKNSTMNGAGKRQRPKSAGGRGRRRDSLKTHLRKSNKEWARQLNTNSGVDFLRDDVTGEWKGVKQAAAFKSGIESNSKEVTMFHRTLDTVAIKSPTGRSHSARRPKS